MTLTSLRPVGYGGLSWQTEDESGRTYLEIVRGLNETPEMRGEDDVMPGAPGRFARNRQPDVRTIELAGFIEGYGADSAERAAAFRTRMKLLQSAFNPELTDVLTVGLEDGTSASINARTLNLLSEQLIAWAARVSIELESVDPNWVTG